MPTYTYNTSLFPSGFADTDLLALEIAAAGLGSYDGCYFSNNFTTSVIEANLIFSVTLTGPQVFTLNAVVAAHAYSGTVNTSGSLGTVSFGNNYQAVTSPGLSTTTSAVFQTKLSMTTPLLSGTYRVQWYAVCQQTNIADAVQSRLQNITDVATIGPIQEKEPKDTNDRFPVGGIGTVVFTGSAKTFEIQYRQQRGSTAGIEDARIEIWRIA